MSESLLDSPYAEAERKRHPVRDVACIVLRDPEGRYLFIRTYKFPDVWGWLGGGREPQDESLQDTAVRELFEESGMVITKDELKPFFQTDFDFGKRVIEFFLVTLATRPDLAFNQEIVEHRWLTVREATSLPMYPASRKCFTHLQHQEESHQIV